MRRRRFAPLLAVSFVGALSLQSFYGGLAPAAENFACGPGGTPDPKTSKCICPAGKIEKTTGGTSRCVEKPAGPKPSATTSTKPSTSSTSGKPSTSTTTTSTTTAPPLPTGTITLPPLPTGTVVMPTTCPPTQVLVDGTCRDRCPPTETWNGYACVSNGTMTTPKPVQCDAGQFPDAAGHCCYAGQVWMEGAGGGRCRGTPSCPTGTMPEGETCSPVACLAGQLRATDGVHCCWTGQDWSTAAQRCVGVPTCPEGYAAEGDRCSPLRLCDPGMIAVDVQHCCYPNQHWMMRTDGQVGCGGPPACPAPLIVAGEDCVAPGKLQDDADRATKSTLWGVGYFAFDFSYNLVTTTESTPDASKGKYNAYGLGMAFHVPAFPLRFSLEGLFGKGQIDGASETTSVSGYALGAAFAPLSLPAANAGPFSFLNPWLGVQYRGWTTNASLCSTSSADCGVPPLTRGTAVVLDVGNMIIIKQLGIVLAYGKSLSGEGSVPTSTVTIGLSYLLTPAL